MSKLNELNDRVSAAKAEVEARGETFYPGASRVHLAAYPPKERWNDWVELDSKSWPKRVEKRYMLVPTTCFNCESACGLLAYVDRDTLQVRKFEGNPEHPGSRGRNCAKGPATINQITDPDRILYPLKRSGARGEGKWERVSWDDALDDIAGRIRKAMQEERHEQVMYHVGRPGEEGYTTSMLAAWAVDGHNSHTNVCSSGARAGYHWWMGMDRPSPDHANAKVIVLVSSHLETGHYFNPHAQRIIEGKKNGAKLIVFDTRLSNTTTHADHWLSPYPGSEAAIFLAVANWMIQEGKYDREFVRRWWNWQEYMEAVKGEPGATFERFEAVLRETYTEYTFEYAAAESGVGADRLKEVAEVIATAGTQLATHNWRSAGSGNLGGWQVARTLTLLNALTGALATVGGTFPNSWNKFSPKPIRAPQQHPRRWNEVLWPREYPLALMEMSFLMPHLMNDQKAYVDTYFTRVYNPVWTNPDGFSWIEMLTDESKIGLHVAQTPTWNETAYFADYVLPMGHSSERHDLTSYEQYDGQWIGFRQPVLRAARERLGETITDTRQVNPGEVWEENEFWIELTWKIDPDGALGIREFFESRKNPGEKMTVDEYYGWMFENSVPGLPAAAEAQGMSPLEYMRQYGAFEVSRKVGKVYEQKVPEAELEDVNIDDMGRVFTRAPVPPSPKAPGGTKIDPDAEGRRRVGVQVDGEVLKGWPTPTGKLEFWSRTLSDWGWPEHAIPTYIKSHIHPDKLAADQVPMITTFRVPVQIHTRSANAKWLDEIAHTNPLWLHPSDAARFGIHKTGDLARVTTDLGYFVLKVWITEGIRPGVVACSHHMGRWKPEGHEGQRLGMMTVALGKEGTDWSLSPTKYGGPFQSSDPDTMRVWWTDIGVHQNLTHAVHPDPISGMHCWHQAVRVTPALPGDRQGDVSVDTARSRGQYEEWLALTRSADTHSPDGTRRPWWMLRPVRPERAAYDLPKTSLATGD
jgi:anaerobic selenocysteine-containing dehydrogenase